MKKVKIVIGANYGDEGKGLMSRYFSQQALEQKYKPITILHNGSVQRGHTVDYSPSEKHVYHHFGCGTAEKVPTYFAETFLVHPMEFIREYEGLLEQHINPPTKNYCDPNCLVITPFDMLVDHITKSWNELQTGQLNHMSLCCGSWCVAEDRGQNGRKAYRIKDFEDISKVPDILNIICEESLDILRERGVKLDEVPKYKDIFNDKYKQNAINHFVKDVQLFFALVELKPYNYIWSNFDYHIFENGSSLGLDKDIDNDYHTSSKTGLVNPYNMLKYKRNFEAEVCYVSRTYLTRHGAGPLENEIDATILNNNIIDTTNTYNILQGDLRYGMIDEEKLWERINSDYAIAASNPKFKRTFAFTHCNECTYDMKSEYISDHKCRVWNIDL